MNDRREFLRRMAALGLVVASADLLDPRRALASVTTTGAGKVPAGGGGGSTTTWNPSNPGAHIVLSNGNLTAVGDGGAASRVLSVGKVAQGSKGKFEWTPNYTDGGVEHSSVGFSWSGQPDAWIGSGGYVNGAASYDGHVFEYSTGGAGTGNGAFVSGTPLAFLCDNSTPATPVMYIHDGTTLHGPLALKPNSDQYAFAEVEATQTIGGTANFGATAYAISNAGYGNLT